MKEQHLRGYTSVNTENLGDFREFFGRKVLNQIFRKIEKIFSYIWTILHNYFIEKYWDPSDLCAAFGSAKKKVLSTADMIPADWVAETEKGKHVVKLKGIFCTMT